MALRFSKALAPVEESNDDSIQRRAPGLYEAETYYREHWSAETSPGASRARLMLFVSVSHKQNATWPQLVTAQRILRRPSCIELATG